MRKLWLTCLLPMVLAVQAQAAEERYYAISIDGKRVGYSHYQAQQTPEGRKIISDSLIKLSLLGTAGEQAIQGISLYTPDGSRPLRYTITSRLNTNKPTTIDCRFHAGEVTLTANLPGRDTTKTFPWTSDCYLVAEDLDRECGRLIRALGPGGKSRTVKYLDVSAFTVQAAPFTREKPESVTVNGRKRLCDVYMLGAGPTALRFVVARDTQEVVEYDVPNRKIAFRAADKTAMKDLQSYEALSRAFAMTDVNFKDPLTLRLLKIKVDGEVVGEKITKASLQSPTQTFEGTVKEGHIQGVFTIRPVHYAGTHAPPFTGKPLSDPKLASYLHPAANIESDDPEIVALAAKLTKGAKTRWEAVQRIGTWVHDNIGYTLTGAGAKQCLTEKTGDCGPHTWLTIALCRAAGIPARITGGALYSEALGGSFGQHYWTRVWMGPDGWIPIDTTTGEVGSLSPIHLTLWNLGGIGSLSVKVLDYAPKPSAPSSPDTPPTRSSIAAHAGEEERYTMKSDGKEIGTQTAECLRTETRNGTPMSDWQYACNMTVSPNGTPIKIDMNGTFTVTDTAAPVSLTLNATVNGAAQKIVCAFSPKKVRSTITIGGSDFPARETTLTGSEFMLLGEISTHLSLLTRALHVQPGQKLAVPVFLANTMQTMPITLIAQPKTETIPVGGKDVECVVCDSSLGSRFWLARDTGALMRATIAAQKLVVERE